MSADHYAALGVSPSASQTEVRAAYLRVMRASHPDHARDDPGAADQARRANAAYEVLGDAAARAAYDRLRASHPHRGRVRGAELAGASHRRRAYSSSRTDYAEAFRRASRRVAVVVLGAGTVLLALVASA